MNIVDVVQAECLHVTSGNVSVLSLMGSCFEGCEDCTITTGCQWQHA